MDSKWVVILTKEASLDNMVRIKTITISTRNREVSITRKVLIQVEEGDLKEVNIVTVVLVMDIMITKATVTIK